MDAETFLSQIEEFGGTVVYDDLDANIIEISLPDTRITDGGLKELESIERLESLNLSSTYYNSTKVSDEILQHLKQLPHLKSLHFQGSELLILV
jgi:hypothetical protein